MVSVIPELLEDETYPSVEADEILEDDGLSRYFAKQFIYEDLPELEVSDEVLDTMCLAVPSVALLRDESLCGDFRDEYASFEGEPEWISDELPNLAGMPLLSAPSEVPLLSAPASPSAEEHIPSGRAAPSVLFSFGGKDTKNSLCMSFRRNGETVSHPRPPDFFGGRVPSVR